MIGFAAEKLIGLEVDAKTGAAYGERNTLRLGQRNGDRDWETRAGTVELCIPKLRTGSLAIFPFGKNLRHSSIFSDRGDQYCDQTAFQT
jgi:transposase-like protein